MSCKTHFVAEARGLRQVAAQVMAGADAGNSSHLGTALILLALLLFAVLLLTKFSCWREWGSSHRSRLARHTLLLWLLHLQAAAVRSWRTIAALLFGFVMVVILLSPWLAVSSKALYFRGGRTFDDSPLRQPDAAEVKAALMWIGKQFREVAPAGGLYAVCVASSAGFASNFQRLAGVAVMALRSADAPRQLVLDTRAWNYGCEQGALWECFFQEPSTPTASLKVSPAELVSQGSNSFLRVGTAPVEVEPEPGNMVITFEDIIPDPWRHKGARWWWAVVQRYLFTLNDEQQARVSALHKQLRLRDEEEAAAASSSSSGRHAGSGKRGGGSSGSAEECSIIGMHVRLGDRLMHDNELHGTAQYVTAAVQLTQLLRACTIVIASDDATVEKTLPGQLRAAIGPSIRVIVLPSRVQRPDSGTTQMSEYIGSSSAVTKRAGTEDILDVIATLSEAHVLVGLCMSQVARVAAALQYAHGRQRHLPVSPDRDFCVSYPGHPYPLTEGWMSMQQLAAEAVAAQISQRQS